MHPVLRRQVYPFLYFFILYIFFTSQVNNMEELEKLQELHDAVYEQAQVWFQNLKIRFHNQILQHFGPMPEREPDIQVQSFLFAWRRSKNSDHTKEMVSGLAFTIITTLHSF